MDLCIFVGVYPILKLQPFTRAPDQGKELSKNSEQNFAIKAVRYKGHTGASVSWVVGWLV